MRTGPQWVSLWQQVSLVDAFVEEQHVSCPTGYHFDTFLDHQLTSSDIMENTLRSLASAVHFKKTGDHESAERMRAIITPGDEIAPGWLADESMEHSRVVHRQRSYLATASKAARDPKDPKDKGKGTKDKSKKKGGGRGNDSSDGAN